MAPRRCKVCGKPISCNATACPHFGKKVKGGMGVDGGMGRSIADLGLVFALVGFIGCGGGGSGGSGGGSNPPPPAPAVTLSPTSLTFASQGLGTTSAAQTITLTNSGNAALSITSIAVTLTNSGDFAETNNCASSVGASVSCTISVTFTPSGAGTRTGSITITDDASDSPQNVGLNGTGTAPVATVRPTSVLFGDTVAGTLALQTVTLTNSSDAVLGIVSIVLSGDTSTFSSRNSSGEPLPPFTDCGSSLAPQGACTINIFFSPGRDQVCDPCTATLTITDDASNSPQTVAITGIDIGYQSGSVEAPVLVAPARGADGPQITVNISPDVPVRITDFRFDRSAAGMPAAFRYDLQNTSGQGLVAIEVRWETSFDANDTARFSTRDDRWLTGLLPSNHTEGFQVSNVPNVPAQVPLSHVSANVSYAEFEDGTALGTDVVRVGSEIAKARRKQLAAYAEILDTFGSGGSDALVQALKQHGTAHDQDPAVQAATAWLLGILSNEGVDGVIEKLQRCSTLSVPDVSPLQ